MLYRRCTYDQFYATTKWRTSMHRV